MAARWLLTGIALAALLGCRGGSAQQNDVTALVAKCQADAAQRAKVGTADVQVVRVEQVVWRDGSLGCPQPGMDYIQMLLPGYRITLRAAGKDYVYHTDEGKRFVYCEGRGQEPAQVQGEIAVPGATPGGKPTAAAQGGVLYIEPVKEEANLNGRLVRLTAAGDKTTVLERCTDFVVSGDGWVLAKERTSRSSHDLLLARIGAEPRVLLHAFDFGALCFSKSDSSYAYLMRASVGEPFRLCWGRPESEPRVLEWAPDMGRGHNAQIGLSGSLLAVSVSDDDDLPQTTLLDLQGERVVGSFRSAKTEMLPGESALP